MEGQKFRRHSPIWRTVRPIPTLRSRTVYNKPMIDGARSSKSLFRFITTLSSRQTTEGGGKWVYFYLSINQWAGGYADFHAELLRGVGAVVVEKGDDQRHHDHGCGAVHGLLVRHGGARLPICQHQAQRYRLERSKVERKSVSLGK